MATYTIDFYNSVTFGITESHILSDAFNFVDELNKYMKIFHLNSELRSTLYVFKVDGVAFAIATPDDLIFEVNSEVVLKHEDLQHALLKAYPDSHNLNVLFDLKNRYKNLIKDSEADFVQLRGLESYKFKDEVYNVETSPPIFEGYESLITFVSKVFPTSLLITTEDNPFQTSANIRAIKDLEEYTYSAFRKLEGDKYISDLILFKPYSVYFESSEENFKRILGIV